MDYGLDLNGVNWLLGLVPGTRQNKSQKEALAQQTAQRKTSEVEANQKQWDSDQAKILAAELARRGMPGFTPQMASDYMRMLSNEKVQNMLMQSEEGQNMLRMLTQMNIAGAGNASNEKIASGNQQTQRDISTAELAQRKSAQDQNYNLGQADIFGRIGNMYPMGGTPTAPAFSPTQSEAVDAIYGVLGRPRQQQTPGLGADPTRAAHAAMIADEAGKLGGGGGAAAGPRQRTYMAGNNMPSDSLALFNLTNQIAMRNPGRAMGFDMTQLPQQQSTNAPASQPSGLSGMIQPQSTAQAMQPIGNLLGGMSMNEPLGQGPALTQSEQPSILDYLLRTNVFDPGPSHLRRGYPR